MANLRLRRNVQLIAQRSWNRYFCDTTKPNGYIHPNVNLVEDRHEHLKQYAIPQVIRCLQPMRMPEFGNKNKMDQPELLKSYMKYVNSKNLFKIKTEEQDQTDKAKGNVCVMLNEFHRTRNLMEHGRVIQVEDVKKRTKDVVEQQKAIDVKAAFRNKRDSDAVKYGTKTNQVGDEGKFTLKGKHDLDGMKHDGKDVYSMKQVTGEIKRAMNATVTAKQHADGVRTRMLQFDRGDDAKNKTSQDFDDGAKQEQIVRMKQDLDDIRAIAADLNSIKDNSLEVRNKIKDIYKMRQANPLNNDNIGKMKDECAACVPFQPKQSQLEVSKNSMFRRKRDVSKTVTESDIKSNYGDVVLFGDCQES